MVGQGLVDMSVMENLSHRPKDQVEETLSLISELMLPLPKGTSRTHVVSMSS
jgi:E3 ubiquitin-protein ligase TRIP12